MNGNNGENIPSEEGFPSHLFHFNPCYNTGHTVCTLDTSDGSETDLFRIEKRKGNLNFSIIQI